MRDYLQRHSGGEPTRGHHRSSSTGGDMGGRRAADRGLPPRRMLVLLTINHFHVTAIISLPRQKEAQPGGAHHRHRHPTDQPRSTWPSPFEASSLNKKNGHGAMSQGAPRHNQVHESRPRPRLHHPARSTRPAPRGHVATASGTCPHPRV